MREHRLEIAWTLFAAVNLIAMVTLARGDGGTIPFHFIWVSLTIVYGFTVWAVRPTVVVLGLVMASTAAALLVEMAGGTIALGELSEVPLMAMMFVAMVWHARRRAAAEQRAIDGREREREFMRDASHHLKTPLAIARGYAELIRGQLSSTVRHGDTDKLVDELDRMTKIVNNLLLVMDSDRRSLLHRRPVDLRELVLDAAHSWDRAIDPRLLVNAPEPAWISGDRERIECALGALIENAVDATDSGGRIWLAVSQQSGVARIQVTDDGRGISPHAAEHIFDRFWSEPAPQRPRGTGLGLSIAKNIVEAHGGTLELVPRDGATVFAIEIPRTDSTVHPMRAQRLDARARKRLKVAS